MLQDLDVVIYDIRTPAAQLHRTSAWRWGVRDQQCPLGLDRPNPLEAGWSGLDQFKSFVGQW
jgi:hypothetical protein